MKNYSGITWSNLELEGLLEDEESCVSFVKVNKHFELCPIQLGHLITAIDEILKRKLNSYDAELDGLLLAYKMIKILSPDKGKTLYDNFYIHIDIEADFYIFKPEVGKSIKGFVNKISMNHIGILVHKAFNVSIPKPEEFDAHEDWPGYCVKIGQEVRFTIEYIDFTSKLPYIRGILKKDDYLNGCSLYDKTIAAAFYCEYKESANNENGKPINKKTFFNHDSEEEINLVNENEENIFKTQAVELTNTSSKKKKRKRKHSSSDEEDRKSCINELSQNSVVERFSETESGKKHKKKKKKIFSSDEEDRKSCIQKLSQNSDVENCAKIEKKISICKKKSNTNFSQNSTGCEEVSQSIVNDVIDQSNIITNEECSSLKTLKKSKKKLNDGSDQDYNYQIIEKGEIIVKSEKKKKNRKIEKSLADDTDDKQRIKKSISKNTKSYQSDNHTDRESDNNNSNLEIDEDELILISKRKKKKKNTDKGGADDTEDERKHKKSIIKNLIVNESNKAELKHSKESKKLKVISVDDDTVMDTEDEKNYKSSLKPLIESLEKNADEDITFKVPKTKKRKKKRSEPTLEVNEELDIHAEIKSEPESEVEGKQKSKKSRKKDLTSNEEPVNEKYESDMEDRKKAKALLKKKLNIKNEDEQETNKKIKKEKSKENSFLYEH